MHSVRTKISSYNNHWLHSGLNPSILIGAWSCRLVMRAENVQTVQMVRTAQEMHCADSLHSPWPRHVCRVSLKIANIRFSQNWPGKTSQEQECRNQTCWMHQYCARNAKLIGFLQQCICNVCVKQSSQNAGKLSTHVYINLWATSCLTK